MSNHCSKFIGHSGGEDPPDAGVNFVSALEDFGDEVDGRFWATPTLELFEPL
jgi:hypothetical protein